MFRLVPVLACLSIASGCVASVELEGPRPYPCDRDAGGEVCPAGTRCGLEGTCHDVTVAAAYVCDVDSDCEGGWHCGAERFCYPLDAGAPYPCREGRGDCADGWRCGREEVCHPVGEGAPYLCERDSDCEADWRCDPDGRCANAALEPALGPSLTPALNASTTESYARRHRADRVSVSRQLEVRGPCGNIRSDSYSLSHGPNLSKLFLYGGPLGFPAADGGCEPPGRVEHHASSELPLGAPPREVVDLQADTLVLMPDGWARTFRFDPVDAGAIWSRTLPGQFLDGGMRVLEQNGVPRFVAIFGEQGPFGLYDVRDGGMFFASGIHPSRPHLRDVDALLSEDATELQLLASATEGLFWIGIREGDPLNPFVSIDGGVTNLETWSPAVSPGGVTQFCGQGGSLESIPQRFFPFLDEIAGVFWDRSFLGFPQPLDDRLIVVSRQGSGTLTDPCSTARLGESDWFGAGMEISPCDRPEEAFQELVSTSGTILSYCASPDGGTSSAGYLYASGSFEFPRDPPELLRWPVTAAGSAASQVAISGRHGQLWRSAQGAVVRSALLDRAPSVVFGRPGTLGASVPPREGDRLPQPLLGGRSFYEAGPWGLRSFDNDYDDFAPVAVVRGKEEWALFDLGNASLGVNEFALSGTPKQGVAALLSDDETWRPPYQAAATALPDGGTLLVVTSYDALLASVVSSTAVPFDPEVTEGLPTLQIQVVPYPRTAIRSFALVDAAARGPSADLAEGFAIIQSRVVRLTARSVTLWNFEELAMPAVDPLEVWTDGAFGRVGYADGRVYSANTRVQLQAALPAEAGPVLEYEQVCGKPVVLTANGLYRAAPADGPLGTWVSLPLPLPLLPPGHDYAGGKLYGVDGSLYYFTSGGWSIEVDGFDCP